MKYLSRDDRERQKCRIIRLARRLSKLKLKRARLTYKKQKRFDPDHLLAVRIYAPETFDAFISHWRSELLTFLSALREHFREKHERVLLIDFSRTKRFYASGTLPFYAELTRLIEYRHNSVKIRCTGPANDRASQVLEQIGIYKLCSHRSHGTPTRQDVVHWRVARGHLVDNTICAPVIEAFEGELATPLVDGLLGGLAEAMANAVHHAYESVRDDGLNYVDVRDWWMFSQKKDGFLSVVFCDLGVGIPATLPIKRPWLMQQMEKFGFPMTDANCIKEAIDDGRSQTGLPGRGHGLGNIIDVVEKVHDGIAIVASNRGYYSLKEGKENWGNYRDSLLGTLIYWHVPLQEASLLSKG